MGTTCVLRNIYFLSPINLCSYPPMPNELQDGVQDLASIAVLIPSWEPEACLLHLADDLKRAGIGNVVVVNDGSGRDFTASFDRLRQAGFAVLEHAVNLGKGRALKTGFNHLLTEHPHLCGVVTADADGQHTVGDIVKVAQRLLADGSRPVLGVRMFAGTVPLRSRLGNVLTRHIFALVTGVRIADTQTGLRGLRLSMVPELIGLEGERYDYEMTMITHLCRSGQRPIEVPIETVYLDGNRSSHFNPVWDSMRIYFVLARFLLSSAIAAGIDFAGFSVAFAMTHHIGLSVAVGRLSSLVNFTLNRGFVFHYRASVLSALWRYYLLAICIGCLSFALIWSLTTLMYWNVFVAKICVDAVLSLVSFSVQRTLIFRRSETV